MAKHATGLKERDKWKARAWAITITFFVLFTLQLLL